ncbi:MAG: DUF721 domain-containing protein [Candidatus Kapaibacteriales bacterium]
MEKNQISAKSGAGTGKHKFSTKKTRFNQTLVIGRIVEIVIKTITVQKNSPLLKIEMAWNKCFEKEITENCYLTHFRNGILTIHTKSNLWQTELLFRRETIIEKLNKYLGEKILKNIIVKIKSD